MPIFIRNLALSVFLLAAFLWPLLPRRSRRAVVPCAAAALALSALMTVTYYLAGVSPLSGFHTDIRPDRINLRPLDGIRRVAKGQWGYALANIAGNILMFAPLGFLAPLLSPRLRRWWKTVPLGLGVSLGIELTQLFLSRGTDVDDLLLNTLGSALGYGAFSLFRRLFPRFTARFDPAEGERRGAIVTLCLLLPYLVPVLCGFYDRWVYLSR